jgi:putative peptidoglycan lipid II flippase
LVRDIYERGAFTAADTQAVAMLLRILSLLVVGAAIGEICSKTLYSLNDSLTPSLVGSTLLILGFAAKLVLVPRTGIASLAWITSAVLLFSGLGQLYIAGTRVGIREGSDMLRHSLYCCLATTAALACGWGILRLPVPVPSLFGLIGGAVVYFTILLLTDQETRFLLRRLLRRGPSTAEIDLSEKELRE